MFCLEANPQERTKQKKEYPILPLWKTDPYLLVDISECSSSKLYHILNALVVPRPIAFVTTLDAQSVCVNAAPFSWYGAVCADPPMISLSIARRQGQQKDTSRNILATGEFVVNASIVQLTDAIALCADDWAVDISETDKANLTCLPSKFVAPPRIAESPYHLECRLHRHLELGHGPLDFIIGELVCIHIRESLHDEKGHLDVSRWDPLCRLNGNLFAKLDKLFFTQSS